MLLLALVAMGAACGALGEPARRTCPAHLPGAPSQSVCCRPTRSRPGLSTIAVGGPQPASDGNGAGATAISVAEGPGVTAPVPHAVGPVEEPMNRARSTRKRRRKRAALQMSAVVVATAALAASGAMAGPATAATGGPTPVPAQTAGSATATGHGIRVGTVKITTRLRNGRYELTDPTRGGLTIKDYLNNEYFGDLELSKPFTGKDNEWGNGTTSSRESAAVDAQFAAEQAWDYFKNTFHRLGPRGDNKGPTLYVHFKKNFSHAQAIDDPMAALFGDGKNNKKPITSLDAVAHEYTHLVSDATAKFGYSAESDALNEATSDIFAAMVEFQASLPSDPRTTSLKRRYTESPAPCATWTSHHVTASRQTSGSPG